MSIQNEMPGYKDLNQLLNQQGIGLTSAEMHGLISGMLCGGNSDSSWQPLIHDLTNEGLAFGHELAEALRKMHAAISDSLEEIIEYVRVASLLCHDTFTRVKPTAPEVRKPTLH